jgi:6,7-dimethyl-8-ribityllumazine synthase
MDMTVHSGICLGNGILTVENESQALDRADPARQNKGGGAARAALEMILIRQKFNVKL